MQIHGISMLYQVWWVALLWRGFVTSVFGNCPITTTGGFIAIAAIDLGFWYPQQPIRLAGCCYAPLGKPSSLTTQLMAAPIVNTSVALSSLGYISGR
ncbi:hypothetical protein XELAEV_18045605mg [Xenopus laevis]|uniref:Uncharacterized protein n=1 Tax=Xenopus laevis TaxID=8355 RepID=A0A974C183_XENLA|nr:hypothetical protein XELAEV_18045605mg [Xenopus laevis]